MLTLDADGRLAADPDLAADIARTSAVIEWALTNEHHDPDCDARSAAEGADGDRCTCGGPDLDAAGCGAPDCEDGYTERGVCSSCGGIGTDFEPGGTRP